MKHRSPEGPNSAAARALHAEIRRSTDGIAGTIAEDGRELPQRLTAELDELDRLLALHGSESSVLCDMADRMFPSRGPTRHSDAVRRLIALVHRDREELRARNGSATRQDVARRAFALGALVRALLEVEAIVVLDPIDRLAPEVFAASPEAALLSRLAHRKAGRRSARLV